MSVDASRISNIPHLGRHLWDIAVGGVAVPALIAAVPTLALAGLVAALWGVPAEEVDGLADRLDVRCEPFAPRFGATGTVRLCNPDDVHLVADQVPAARAAAAQEAGHREAG